MAIAIESGNLWLRGAADQVAAYAPVFGGDSTIPHPQAEQLVAYANMARTAIEQICIDVMQLCQRSVGTRGLLPPNPMERIIRDLTIYLRQPAFLGLGLGASLEVTTWRLNISTVLELKQQAIAAYRSQITSPIPLSAFSGPLRLIYFYK